MDYIPEDYLDSAMDYPAYRVLVDKNLAAGKTTGINNSPAYLEYSRMNSLRMKRLDRRVKLEAGAVSRVERIEEPFIWLVLTEGWCGDAAQSLPVIAALADKQPNIDLRLLLRDRNLPLIDQFLTQGGRSIPKLIMLEAKTRKVVGSWGPRPEELQTYVLEARRDVRATSLENIRQEKTKALSTYIQKWYARDKGQSIQLELMQLLPAGSVI